MKIICLSIIIFINIFVVNGCGETNTAERLTIEEPALKIMRINYNDFDLLANSIFKMLFQYDPEKMSGYLESGRPYKVQGRFDLNSDGVKDDIKVNFSALSIAYTRGIIENSYIIINDSDLEISFQNPRGVYLVDFNDEDSFKELIVFDDGRSGDPEIFLYRYNGEEIIELGRIGGEIWYDEKTDAIKDEDSESIYLGSYKSPIKIDGRGRILSPWDVIDFVSPEIVLGVREIKDNYIEHIKVNKSNILNKEYEINRDITAYFIETEKEISDFAIMSFDKDKMITFKQGEKIYIKDICNEFRGRYIVELENGKRGVLYFWIGD